MPPLPPCILALAALSGLAALCFAAMAVWHGLRFEAHSKDRGHD